MTLKSIKKARIMCMVTVICALCLGVRLYYLCIVRYNYYSELARDVQERTRKIKSPRGLIYDRNGLIIADNTIVYTINLFSIQFGFFENTRVGIVENDFSYAHTV